MKLSVALCTYNGSLFIETQINSILKQSVPIDEIIVCDDNSNDTTIQILKKIQKKNPSIVIVKNEINLKSTKNFEKAISLCTGDYIFLADQDDIWHELKVEKIVAIFKNNSTAEGVFSNASLIDENNTVFTNKTIWDSVFFMENELQKPIDYLDLITKNGNIVTGATLCIKKEIKSFILPFSDKCLHDEWIAILLGLRNSLFYSTENLISYRIHSQQQVGMKNLNKIEKKIHKKKILIGFKKPRKFSEYRLLQKKEFLKQEKIVQLSKLNFNFINFDSLLNESTLKQKDLNNTIKNMFPLHFLLVKAIDTILQKRKN
jgi:glycosyltransferase involved in cell wall biosynthesis